ncbi:ribonuclease [Burkholderia dolosa]|jgi:ribonuclease T1|uniref:Ribonuclease n=1 Tax=Burkholderia dolosa TaxID=152500 RepID=A0A892I3Z0_9BURK|nr:MULTISPECIES: ribonuclease [Burkholderia]AKE04620.1 ribonuclease [Burkholderia cepacia]AJY13058.1 ribonuclease family protein [Burkholderia dolosa AU0158]AYZ96567.1 ribonuclease [Burkholderia dolosa]EAY69762.1 Guanyl-specific ribonuclease Sa [Burkholderia dolosa AU0158]ETP66437.1 ribonuclease [Burkholderia dolosa PC543]
MARKWLRNGALASVFAMFAMGIVGTPTGSLVSAAYAREAVSADVAAGGFDTIPTSRLPREAVTTLGLISAGGPYPYEKDGVVFGNRERILPKAKRGYYREYTVPTPRARNRGARRIVCGGPLRRIDNCYYTDDHYNSFKRIVE